MKRKINMFVLFFVTLSFYSAGFAEDYWMKMGFDELTTDIFYTAQDDVIIVSDGKTFISKDKGISWDTLLTCRTKYIDDTGNYLYISYRDSIYVTHKDSSEWRFLYATDLNYGLNGLFVHNNNRFMYNWGQIIKFDENWNNPRIVFEENNEELISSFVVDSVGTLYAGSTDYMNLGESGGVYKSYDNGETWNELTLENHYVTAMAVDSEGRVFVGTHGHQYDGGGRIFRSIDNGTTWDLVASGTYVYSMAINSEDEIFVGLDYDSGTRWVLFSEDHGDTWRLENEGLSTGHINDIVISSEGYVYLATGGGNISSAGVYRSYRPTTAFASQFIAVNNSQNNIDAFGLTGALDIELKNIGVLPASDVILNATSNSEYITFNDSTEYFGNILEDDSLSISNCLSYTIASNTPDQEVIKINIEITDSSGEIFYGYINIVLDKPLLEFSHTVSGYEAIYPTDSRDVTFQLKNSSPVNINDITTELIEVENSYVLVSDPVNLTNINAYTSKYIDYTCNFSHTTPVPQDITMRLNLQSSNGIDTFYDFTFRVGMTEDFETGDLSQNNWRFYGNADWYVDSIVSYKGSYSLKSGDINDDEYSVACLDLNFLEDGYVSFYKKVSCPSGDELVFVIDGVRDAEWSGELDWTYEIFPVNTGIHSIQWKYNKNNIDVLYDNCAWIDNILVTGIETGIEERIPLPDDFRLYQNYPNPFNPCTTVEYQLHNISNIEINIFNTKGQFVYNLINRRQGKGRYSQLFNASKFNSGVYYYQLKIDGIIRETRKMLYLR